MIKYAAQLGADCAFFIKNRPMLAMGIGEQLSELKLSLAGKFISLVYPSINISTKEAYSRIVPDTPSMRIKDILKKHKLVDWKKYLVNDFEQPLFKKYPILHEIKQQFYKAGALYASMSGSGSCMYGIFENEPEMIFDENHKVWSGEL